MAKGFSISGVGAFFNDVIGSRLAMAVCLTFLVAFATQAATAPDRFPPIARVGLLELGLVAPPPAPVVTFPPAVEEALTPDVKAQIRAEAQTAALQARPYVHEAVDGFFMTTPGAIRWANYVGAGVSLFALVLATGLYARKLRGAQGAAKLSRAAPSP